MRNGMRSLWDFDEEDSGSDAVPSTEMGNGPSRAASLSAETIGPQIQARLEAGDPPGKIAMYLEQLEPGLGRALLGQINQAAGSTKRVSASPFAQRNYGESPTGGFSAFPRSNGMPVHPTFRSDPGGDAPQAIYGGAGRSVGINPAPFKSAAVSVPNDDNAGHSDGFQSEGRSGSSMLGASSQQNRPAYRELAYKPDDQFWGPPPEKPGKRGLLSIIGRELEGKIREEKASFIEENPRIRSNFDRTIKAVIGDSFSPEELNLISREIIDNISIGEGAEFQDGVQTKGGVVYLDGAQWRAVHRLIGTIPKDKLGNRVRSALVQAEKSGKLRRRKG